MQTLLAMKHHELPLNEALVLAWIVKNPGARQSDWSKAFNMGPTVSSPLVRRLVSKKLVSDETVQDKRTTFKIYYPTLKGRQIADITTSRINLMADVTAFHEKFQLAYDGPPRLLPKELSDLSVKCLKEEVKEYEDAIAYGDLEGQFDALIDLVYFAIGRAHLHGFPFNAGWERVQEANMAKVRAKSDSDSKRGSSFDVVKPEGWQAPVLTDLVH